jgi:hypothetical protein
MHGSETKERATEICSRYVPQQKVQGTIHEKGFKEGFTKMFKKRYTKMG